MDLFNNNQSENINSNFFTLYPLFNFIEYKNFNNELKDYNLFELYKHYHDIGCSKNLICSIKHFYNLYPDFNIHIYKLFNKELEYLNYNINYLIHYHNVGCYQNKIYSLNKFKEIYDIDFLFLQNFYDIFSNKNEIEIINILLEHNNFNEYILSNNYFIKEFPEFNIIIYKVFNSKLLFHNDTKYKSYWYHSGRYENQIYKISDVYIKYKDFNIDLYKKLYNINDKLEETIIKNWYINKDNLIYSYDTFINNIDDFNYNIFKKHYPIIKNIENIKILDFYIKNIDKINNIYSEKLFYLKYPTFNLHDYKKFNDKNNNLINNFNFNFNFNIYNEYHLQKNKDSIIISINDFNNKFSDFNLKLYKNIHYNINYNDNDYLYNWYLTRNINTIYSIESFFIKYPDFNINIYKYFNNILNIDYITILVNFHLNNSNNSNIIYSMKTFYKYYHDFDIDIYITFNNLYNYTEEELIFHFHSIGIPQKLIYNEENTLKKLSDFNINIYKELNRDLYNLNNKELIIHWYKKGKKENRIYSEKSFYEKYPNSRITISNYDNNKFKKEDEKIIYWMNQDYNNSLKQNHIIGRQQVNDIYEVLMDLSNKLAQNKLEKGISLIIRAKNEELNIKDCIESVVDLVDEIIFVDNKSTDNTYKIMQEYEKKFSNIKLYKYNINVSKVGIEHENAIKNNNKNTLGTFYNWCLSKATKYNVFKWDADFICIRSNFIQLTNIYNLKNRDDRFAIWFTGKTLFINDENYYLNYNSFYNEFRIFSYKNNFQWYDGNICEYTDPYINSCTNNKKYKYEYPLFYELKRTSINEFEERSSLIDKRDINDLNILNNFKENNNKFNLIKFNNNIINNNTKIIIYTPSLSLGGGNQFIINIYNILKIFGFNVIIIPSKTENVGKNKFNKIIQEDIYDIKKFDIEFIKKYNPHFILFNSDIPFSSNDIELMSKITKIIFVTHSDIAYANYFVKTYYTFINYIITVNNYTINKLVLLLNFDKNKFYKLVNYTNLDEKLFIKNNINKNNKFGVISRFSEDKNMPMFLFSLIDIFKIYPNYKCYLIGCSNEYYDNYLKKLCIILNINKFIFFEGYQENTLRYYEMFDFIILPSVSEGCSYNIIEAMSLGVPIIASDVGGNHELIHNDKNGILYSYDGIKEYEQKNVFVTNYNEELSIIGYFINNTDCKNNYIINNDIINICNKNNVIVPYYILCKIHNKDYNNNCQYCINIKNKSNTFDNNKNNIKKSIITMINYDNNMLNVIKEDNYNFIKNYFNIYIYINQILDIFK